MDRFSVDKSNLRCNAERIIGGFFRCFRTVPYTQGNTGGNGDQQYQNENQYVAPFGSNDALISIFDDIHHIPPFGLFFATMKV